uniref:Uncharacterized protein n=1 Tax=Arundo donax TaxID=35708 RepID=A0A0A9E7F6_ARUDO
MLLPPNLTAAKTRRTQHILRLLDLKHFPASSPARPHRPAILRRGTRRRRDSATMLLVSSPRDRRRRACRRLYSLSGMAVRSGANLVALPPRYATLRFCTAAGFAATGDTGSAAAYSSSGSGNTSGATAPPRRRRQGEDGGAVAATALTRAALALTASAATSSPVRRRRCISAGSTK